MSQQPKPMTLVEFLLARIADDEAAAGLCRERSWQYDDGAGVANEVNGLVVQHAHVWGPSVSITTSAAHQFSDMQHIANWDPARVLAECEAKRRVIEALGNFEDGHIWASGEALRAQEALEAMTLPHADHPDYQQEWKP